MRKKKRRVRADGGKIGGLAHRQECAPGATPNASKSRAELVLDDIRQRADDQQGARRSRSFLRQRRDERGEAGVFALRERRLDAAAGIAENSDTRRVKPRLPRRRALQIDLDDLGRAGADEEQELDVGPALEQAADDAVEFVVDVGDAGEVAFVEDRRREARLGEDHDAGRGLDEMRAGARPDDQEERVLNLAVQPDDARSARKRPHAARVPAEPGRCRSRRLAWLVAGKRGDRVHGAPSHWACGAGTRGRRELRRAARSFRTNCVALIDVGRIGREGQKHQASRVEPPERQAPRDRPCAGRGRAC